MPRTESEGATSGSLEAFPSGFGPKRAKGRRNRAAPVVCQLDLTASTALRSIHVVAGAPYKLRPRQTCLGDAARAQKTQCVGKIGERNELQHRQDHMGPCPRGRLL